MTAFRVWIRSIGNSSRVRVDGRANTLWLIGRLSRSFVFKTAEPIHEERESLCCTFDVQYSSQIPRAAFERLLATIPEAILMAEQA